MSKFSNQSPRDKIIFNYAAWTAVSALRSGSPVKKRTDIVNILKKIEIEAKVQDGWKSKDDFNEWHKYATETIIDDNTLINVGWATKIINIYLKTSVYVGGINELKNIDYLHPPIDGLLWNGLKKKEDLLETLRADIFCVEKIKDIKKYDDHYFRIIGALEKLAENKKIKLIEIDSFWAYIPEND